MVEIAVRSDTENELMFRLGSVNFTKYIPSNNDEVIPNIFKSIELRGSFTVYVCYTILFVHCIVCNSALF